MSPLNYLTDTTPKKSHSLHPTIPEFRVSQTCVQQTAMTLIKIVLLLSLLTNASSGSVRGLEECTDIRGKFLIPGETVSMHKNCQYVRNNDMSLCDKSENVRTQCQQLCDMGSKVERGKFDIKFTRDPDERNCQFIRTQAMDLCTESVVSENCPKTCGLCPKDDEQQESCVDTQEKFRTRKFGKTKRGDYRKRTCDYVGENLPELCKFSKSSKSNKKVQVRCKATCGLC